VQKAVRTHDVKLRSRADVAQGTMAFRFDKPPGFDFKPGQAIDLVLAATPGGEAQAVRHTFSLASAPFENELEIATRMRDSPYKRALASLPVGAAAALEGPFGSLTLHKDTQRAAIFIAGGIGITPFLSMLRQAAHDRRRQPLALLYSNRRPEDAAFLDELHRLERENDRFRLVATMTALEKSTLPWQGAVRMIDAELVEAAARGLPAPVYYVAGPPGMVEGVRKTLNLAGIEDDDIRSEEFYGY
jgi:ferredoxin-NADP reductase